MDLQTTIYIFVGLSFALYLGIAVWARRDRPMMCCPSRHPAWS